jgi:hypothetical protein
MGHEPTKKKPTYCRNLHHSNARARNGAASQAEHHGLTNFAVCLADISFWVRIAAGKASFLPRMKWYDGEQMSENSPLACLY